MTCHKLISRTIKLAINPVPCSAAEASNLLMQFARNQGCIKIVCDGVNFGTLGVA